MKERLIEKQPVEKRKNKFLTAAAAAANKYGILSSNETIITMRYQQ